MTVVSCMLWSSFRYNNNLNLKICFDKLHTSFGSAHLPNATGLRVTSTFLIGIFGCSDSKRRKGGSKSAVSMVGCSLAENNISL